MKNKKPFTDSSQIPLLQVENLFVYKSPTNPTGDPRITYLDSGNKLVRVLQRFFPSKLITADTGESWDFVHNYNILPLVEIVHSLKVKSLIDLGSGPGLILYALSCFFDYRLKLSGIEYDKNLVDIGNKVLGDDKDIIKEKDLNNLNVKDIFEYDIIYTWDPFKHKAIGKFGDKLASLMRKDQYLVMYNCSLHGYMIHKLWLNENFEISKYNNYTIIKKL
jgi:hypothetical protein